MPIRDTVDWLSAAVGILPEDYALKLAVFHTVFNVLGVLLMLPLMRRLIAFLEHRIVEPVLDVSRPRYLNEAVDEFPQTLETALRKEVLHLSENALDVILHGLNLHRHQVLSADSVIDIVRKSRTPIEIDIDDEYERRIKTLYSAILDFTTETADRVYALREIATDIVKSVKSVKHLRKNVLAYTTRPRGTVTKLYDNLRAEIARVVIEIHKLGLAAPEDRSALWLDQERAQIEEGARSTSTRVESLIRAGDLTPYAATSFLNDSGYAYGAMRDLIAAARNYYIERDSAMAEVERLLSLDDEELGDSLAQNGAESPGEASGAPGHKTIAKEAHHAQAFLDKGDV